MEVEEVDSIGVVEEVVIVVVRSDSLVLTAAVVVVVDYLHSRVALLLEYRMVVVVEDRWWIHNWEEILPVVDWEVESVVPVVFHRNYLAVVFVTVETVDAVVVEAGVVPHDDDDDADTRTVVADLDSDDGPCHRVVAV